MDNAGVKEAQEVQEKAAESTGSVASGPEPRQQQEDGHREGGTPAKAISREREAGWGDYFR